MFNLRTITVAIAALVVSSAASASYIGDTVSCASSGFFTGCSPTTAVVGAGAEFVINTPVSGYKWSVDIGASSVVFKDNSPGGSSGGHGMIFLTDFDWVGGTAAITGIANFATDATYGITASDISFTADSITIDATNSGWGPGQQLSFDIVTNAVPEPGSFILIGLGLFGLGLSRRKQA